MRRLLLIVVCALVFLGALGHVLFDEYVRSEKFQDARERLMLVASNAAPSIDAGTLLDIPLRMDGDKSQEYKTIFDSLLKVKEANPFIKYIYIMTSTDQPGVMQYIVDADPLPEIITAKGERAFPGDTYQVQGFPEMLDAFRGPRADKALATDGWGTTLSGYAPIRDETGRAVAILCIDMDAGPLVALQKKAGKTSIVFWSVVLFLLIVILADLSYGKQWTGVRGTLKGPPSLR
jgi:methyl-accepting chemotaxis protein